MSRILDINPVYASFFIKNLNERYLILQGGRRSGKSVSCYQWITILLMCEKKECIVLTASYPAATNAIKDFQIATGLTVSGNSVYGNCHIFPNGSVISFRAFDEPQKAQGTYCNYAIVEEALNIDEQIFTVFSMSVTDQIYFLYNPTRDSWTNKYLKPDKKNYLKTTYKSNPYLTTEQLKEFELIEKRAASPTASILDIYNKKVYCDGDFSEMGGKVFPVIFTCTEDEYNHIEAYPSRGLDFGFTEGGDQTALVEIKIKDNCLYAKQLIYSSSLGRDEDLAEELRRVGIDEYTTVPADFGGLGRTRIMNLREEYGFDIINCIKGKKVIDDIQRLLQFDKIIIVETSVDLRNEFGNYELTPEGKPKNGIADHLVDATRYAHNYARVNYLY